MRALFFLIFISSLNFLRADEGAIKNLTTFSEPIQIVAAENFYGDIAQQVGGKLVHVTSIMNNLHQDPHEFQPTVAVAKAVADADIVIANGLGYDAWMDKLIATKGKPNRVVITVANFITTTRPERANPHLWYNPEMMLLLADHLAEILKTPAAALAFHQKMKPLFEKMTFLKMQYPHLSVTATEPLFVPMAKALGWEMLHENYQWAMMNETEPSFQEIVDYQESLKNQKVRLLFYNSQTQNPSTQELQHLAEKNKIPVIGITELQPSKAASYQAWMLAQLGEVEHALAK